jgi:hypothetical protein
MPGNFLDRNGKKHNLRGQDEVVLYDGERIPVMSNLSQILKDYTKAVMVSQPRDALAFSHVYFKDLAMQGRQARALPSATTGGSKLALSAGRAYRSLPIHMQERIEQIFMAFDADESGSINRHEFFEMLVKVRAGRAAKGAGGACAAHGRLCCLLGSVRALAIRASHGQGHALARRCTDRSLLPNQRDPGGRGRAPALDRREQRQAALVAGIQLRGRPLAGGEELCLNLDLSHF